MPSPAPLPKHYEPAQFEDDCYRRWEEAGAFRPDPDPSREPYSIVMPPPNITGQLHMGHALNNGLQDIFIRWRRMQGRSVLWQPGTDHASIATEARIVESLSEEGTSKDALGREAFLERAWEWKRNYGDRIVEQLRRLGCSCDWSRLRFTMDEGLSAAVQRFFIELYERGLIYRGLRMVNWCPHCLTTISDIEVVHVEQDTKLWHIRYPIVGAKPDSADRYLILATTRPETLLGDTAVAVNPEDERYRELIGAVVKLPLTGRRIPIVADEYVDPAFGTGVVKITPAHDPNDYAVAQRHELPSVVMMTPEAHVAEGFGRYSGMDLATARRSIVADLEAAGLLAEVEPYRHAVGTCQRCSHIVEPRPMEQWFVRMAPLAEQALEVVRDGRIRLVPERFNKIYFDWLENIQDWCISRQLWWGHRIPVWHCEACGTYTVIVEAPAHCEHCEAGELVQDPDTLDTWFSSALWPFSTLGWPEETPELARYYPTDILVTGYDIIFFWVARMIFSALDLTGEPPFHTVVFNGIVRDAEGRKMSKSLNNGIDPLEVIDEFGADALRYALVNGTAPGGDQRFQRQLTEAGRAFGTKLWNATRFVLMQLPEGIELLETPTITRMEDRWILAALDDVTRELTQNLERFETGLAIAKIYGFIWDKLCDWYIEMVKPRLAEGHDSADAYAAYWVLVTVLDRALRLLHPFMPFITEVLHGQLPATSAAPASELIMLADWPEARDDWRNPAAERQMEQLMEAVRGLRNLRAEYRVPPRRQLHVYLVAEEETLATLLLERAGLLGHLAGVSALEPLEGAAGLPGDTMAVALPGAALHIRLGELVDLDEERRRLEGQLAEAQKQVASLERKLANEQFVSRAPEAVIQKERDKLQRQRELEHSVAEQLERIRAAAGA